MRNNDITPDDLHIWKAYNRRCVFHPGKLAVTLHEEPPKSLNPDWKKQPENRYPVCNDCHDRVHRMSRKQAKKELDDARAQNFPDAVDKIVLSRSH
jgi:hypothetical protein